MRGLQHTGAFVVQIGERTDFTAGRANGLAEHVATGRTVHFESVAELLAFLAGVLEKVRSSRERAT